ncbi:hypothetical protein S58_16650 [Bradyrhizobium oligotrophicum S58]|uniref:Uncharacterized protein n=1 Tax=Bradyrhizobium oligotrophicum S58 TaxID=1245469 RepID=M4Z2Z0_9BRAD|nr:hypothetical protein [Bradyrhizobium oligotrophicum]BAM87673.1 hypothetical protein S58_16650 [Bradyrhizobium oligotrophicum S58]
MSGKMGIFTRGDDLRDARAKPDETWKLGGDPLTAQEPVHALGLSEKHGAGHFYNMEKWQAGRLGCDQDASAHPSRR